MAGKPTGTPGGPTAPRAPRAKPPVARASAILADPTGLPASVPETPIKAVAAILAEPLPPVAPPREPSPPLPPPVSAAPEPVAPEIVASAVPTRNAPPLANVQATLEKEETIMDETINTETVNTVAGKSQAMFADANDRAKAAMEKGTAAFEQFNDFSKGNIEALVESGKIAAKGIETMGHDAADYSRRSFESMTAAMKTFATVKSPTEFFKLQSDFVRQAFDQVVAETSKNTEAMLKLAGEVAQPISNRVALAAEKVKIAA